MSAWPAVLGLAAGALLLGGFGLWISHLVSGSERVACVSHGCGAAGFLLSAVAAVLLSEWLWLPVAVPMTVLFGRWWWLSYRELRAEVSGLDLLEVEDPPDWAFPDMVPEEERGDELGGAW